MRNILYGKLIKDVLINIKIFLNVYYIYVFELEKIFLIYD